MAASPSSPALLDADRAAARGDGPLDPAAIDRLDRAHLWHPYAPPERDAALPVVAAAQGVRLTLADGRTVIDGMSSWWAAIHGYRVPQLDAAARGQLDRMAHVMFGGLTHEPAVRLAARLVDLAPDPLRRVFLADSGSVAMEVAIKVALQRQLSRGRPGRHRLLTWRGGYHGDTFGAMAVCDPVGGMHHLFAPVLPEHVFVDAPPPGVDAPLDEGYVSTLRAAVARHADELAAIVVEPVVQGAGGMRFHAPGYLRVLRELCDEHDLLLVLDEIATGFGRTGALFACEHAGVVPDVLAVGKALTGGYCTMAAVLCTDRVAEEIGRGEAGVLMHGPTFMANPLAASIACASIDLLLERDWAADVARIAAGLRAALEPARALPGVADLRVLGAIGVVQLDHPVDVAAATAAALERGVWIRPFRDLVYVMPPYATDDEDLATICAAVCAAAAVA
ncbi:adenosylmethionine--8-amino-7-oxononanoate transaminase [Patulibacter brassicae]|uniref:Adenosylmethionine-8-amino-7-oxononanoate aminotransferase n=1 Tax=Patulibacter brassicae TaxID=1705717 RepID=A0ABU4VQ86_9ACTN|nr:adenosylmethionine--8-amino-7-oxononanoate transaminase [Patulibacter brassicae]MDX8153527.1 adenosylmethionine--8-amino-7-oxononanoate transaminase [Patulibacter brassicae]